MATTECGLMTDSRLRVLRRSRTKPQPGDVFAMQLLDGPYLFGQVVLADFYGPMPGSNLVYVYELKSETKLPDLGMLTPDRLLIPPAFVNNQGWLNGYWETVTTRELTIADKLPTHCFRDFTGRFYDENFVELPGPVEPCGIWDAGHDGMSEVAMLEALGAEDGSRGA